jgi:REP-associated tyrosine transposase
MPRPRRVFFPDVPHHLTQRGNHRGRTFISPGDHEAYLRLLSDNARKYSVEVVAYCLMPNHVHLVAIPSTASGIQEVLKAVHGQYAQRINRMLSLKGHLWQGRYFSSPLDSNYFRNAVRYVELNPVRARLAVKAEEYEWSSAAAHCGLRPDVIVDTRPRSIVFADVDDWAQWLAAGLPDECLEAVRSRSSRNLPCGSEDFIDELERVAGCALRHRNAGRRPNKRVDPVDQEIGERLLF